MTKRTNIDHRLKPWHVLQVLKDDLKVDFDSLEFWMADMPEDYEVLVTDFFKVKVATLDYLRILYKRGLDETGKYSDEVNRGKYKALNHKYIILSEASRG